MTVPLTAVYLGADKSGETWINLEPVIAVYAKVVTRYVRRARSPHDGGDPVRPPTPRTLADEAYEQSQGPTAEFGALCLGEYGLEDPFQVDTSNLAVEVVPTDRIRVDPAGNRTAPAELLETLANRLNEPYRTAVRERQAAASDCCHRCGLVGRHRDRVQRAEGPKRKKVLMLVLSRKLGERIYIGEDICVTVVDIDRGKIRLGIEAPNDVPIQREELLPLKPVAAREPK